MAIVAGSLLQNTKTFIQLILSLLFYASCPKTVYASVIQSLNLFFRFITIFISYKEQ